MTVDAAVASVVNAATSVLYTTQRKDPDAGTRLRFECDGKTLKIRYAPKEVQYDPSINDWQEQPRPGKKALLVTGQPKLARLSMQIRFANGNDKDDKNASVATDIDVLRAMGNSSKPISIFYDSAVLNGSGWRLMSMSVMSEERQPHPPNEVTRATVTVEFAEYVGANTSRPQVAVNTVFPVTKKSNTYLLISVDKYKDTSYAQKLFDKNAAFNKKHGIKNIRSPIPVGSKIKLVKS